MEGRASREAFPGGAWERDAEEMFSFTEGSLIGDSMPRS